MPSKSRPSLPAASSVLGSVIEAEQWIKSTLHHHIVALHSLPAKWLAAATGYAESTVYKNLDVDAVNGLSFRAVYSAAMGSPVLWQAIKTYLAGRLDPEPGAMDVVELFGQMLQAKAASSESAALEYASLQDGRISAGELVALEGRWAAEDVEREAARAQIRGMAEADDDAGQLGRLRTLKVAR